MDDTTLVESSPQKPQDKENRADTVPTTKVTQSFLVPTNLGLPIKKDITKEYSIGKKQVKKIEEKKLIKHLNIQCEKYDLKILYKEKTELQKEITQLKTGIHILQNYEKELKVKELITKWRDVCQAGMSYMYNSAAIKIDRMGGFEEFRRKELENEKRRLEYQMDDSLQLEVDSILESEEFNNLTIDDQEEYKTQMNEKLEEMEKMKNSKLEALEAEMESSRNQTFTMQELAKRLKVDYKFIFLEETDID
ncbi:hypothetical protein TBLA_0E04130 [Henningerozyma blattae CBS 6284]|uniref:Meiosis protein 5 n=1 Tax=Henningerozyma blattae (strain ATCC 34711 / CBS 6284 / DSM 70876 / NBRC 10599 / NRRL Y-10934 / UCD 77-7) TaxID=1071380 RepID=I2H516_HENB6|nr:hypothetical protein TBLA_0E04130 [Tetrapisispora blattae CBS 6284]CCH61468.1 hypothetical protein TBLA_0E04130 [Tetrapisispora blattae CBS 6284]